eukprot:UN00585
MWFLVFLTYLTLSVAIEPLIETLPNHSFYTPAFYNHPSCYAYGARSTGIGWCARDEWAGEGQYLQVDLLEACKIHSVSTWPCKNLARYVKTYRLSYSMDGETLIDYPEIFNGNTASSATQEINNVLDPEIVARYLRFTPLAYSVWRRMRIEAYGTRNYSGGDAMHMFAIADIANYKDYLIVLVLMLNVLIIGIIGYVLCYLCTGKKKKYGFKKVYSSDDDDENVVINM